jgi:2,4-dienoyl-CoA reductase-like NADH-dependent reductase (Old Yellow Enzyme family)
MTQAKTIPHADLVEKIKAHCEARNIPVTTFGKAALNDPNLLRDLARGRELRSRSREKVLRALNGQAAK